MTANDALPVLDKPCSYSPVRSVPQVQSICSLFVKWETLAVGGNAFETLISLNCLCKMSNQPM